MKFLRRAEQIKTSREDIILSVFYLFFQQNKKEVSIPEFMECVIKIQQKIPLNYSFLKHSLYSIDVMSDIEEIREQGYVQQYRYWHNGLLPKSFFTLTPVGNYHSKKVIERYSLDFIKSLDDIVLDTINDYREKWKLWGRSTK